MTLGWLLFGLRSIGITRYSAAGVVIRKLQMSKPSELPGASRYRFPSARPKNFAELRCYHTQAMLSVLRGEWYHQGGNWLDRDADVIATQGYYVRFLPVAELRAGYIGFPFWQCERQKCSGKW